MQYAAVSKWVVTGLLLILVCSLGIAQPADTTATDTAAMVSPFMQKVQQLGDAEAIRSIEKYEAGKKNARQESLLKLLREITRELNIILARDFDSVSIDASLQYIEKYHATSKQGIFDPNAGLLTHRNLLVTSAILDELVKVVQKTENQLSNYLFTLEDFRNTLDSVYSDPVLYQFGTDSVEAVKYYKKLASVVKEIGSADTILNTLIEAAGRRLYTVEDLLFDLKKSRQEIEKQRAQIDQHIWARELPTAFSIPGTVPLSADVFGLSYQKESLALWFYTRNNGGRIGFLIFITLALWLFLRKLKRMYTKDEAEIEDAYLVLQYPFCSAMVISISLFQFIFLNPPFIFNYVLWLLAVAALTVILKHFITPYWFRFWMISLSFFALAGAGNMVLQTTPTERWIMLALSLAGFLFSIVVLKTGRYHEIREKRIVYFIWIMLAFEALAFIFNLSGRINLSKSFLVSGYMALVFAILLLWAVRLINQMLGIVSKVFKHSERSLSFINFEKIGEKVPMSFYLLLMLGWIILTGRNFHNFRQVTNPFNEMISTPRTIGSYSFTLDGVFFFLVILLLSMLLSKIVSFFATDPEVNFGRDKKKIQLGSYLLLVRILIISLGLFLAFAASGMPLDKITIVIGALGVGIGLGLQSLVNNLVSGLIIAFEKPVNVGDAIEVGGKPGTMKSIGFRSSVVVLNDGASLIIPNGDLLSQHLINWSMGKGNKKITLRFPVSTLNNLDEVLDVLHEILSENKGIVRLQEANIAPYAFSKGAIEMEVQFWVKHYGAASSVTGQVISAIKKQFEAERIKVPDATQEIKLV